MGRDQIALVSTDDPVEKGYLSANPLRALRRVTGMSKDVFCKRAGMSTLTLLNYETWARFPKDPTYRQLAIDRIGNVFNVNISNALEQWEAEAPYSTYHRSATDLSEGKRQFFARKYRAIGHALIETERMQRELRLAHSFEQKKFHKLLNRPNAPIDEMALLVSKLERLHNREVSTEARRLKLIEDQARMKRALDAIKRDEDIAAEWAEKHKDELAPFKQDWKLYFGVPFAGPPQDSKAEHVRTDDWTQMRSVDSTGHLLLEDAILGKIHKEREGYFCKLDYSGRGYSLQLLNDDNYLPALGEVRALDDLREARREKHWRASGGSLNASGHRRNLGQLYGHDVGTAGADYDKVLQAEAEDAAIRRSKQFTPTQRQHQIDWRNRHPNRRCPNGQRDQDETRPPLRRA